MDNSRPYVRFVLVLFLALPFHALATTQRGGTAPPKAVTACADWMATRSSADGAQVRRIGSSTLCADIPSLSDAAVEDFVRELALLSGDTAPDIVIRSAGGRVDLGLTMGEALQRRRAAVYAYGFCGSSCANYVFLAAARRGILNDTLLVFHGGLYRSMLTQAGLTEEGKARMDAQISRQHALLQKAGVEPVIFERMEALNHDGRQLSDRCGDVTPIRNIVFSAKELAAFGARVDQDFGPQTTAEVESLTRKYGIAQGTCYWH